jgi:deoxyribodipyrimidine photolyase-related protein
MGFFIKKCKKYTILINGDEPEGVKWNYDSENRKPPSAKLNIPEKYITKPDQVTKDVIQLVEKYSPDHFSLQFHEMMYFYL